MTEYIVKSMFCFLVLYLGYTGFFRNSRNYEINRMVLLFSVLFALVVPALKMTPASLPVPLIQQAEPFQKALTLQNSLKISESLGPVVEKGSVDLSEVYFAIYIFVCILLFGRFIFHITVLLVKARRSEKIDYKGINLTLIDGSMNPFTFFNTVFISRATYQEEKIEEELILHELAHKKQLHSVEIVVLELVQVVFWFNPFVYLFKRLVKENHEYLADDFVLKSGVKSYDYSNKLINHTFGRKTAGFASGFSHGFLKSRLVRLSMFNQKRRPSYQLALFIPLLILIFTLTAFNNPVLSLTGSKVARVQGVFYADTIHQCGPEATIWLKGRMNVKFGANDFTGEGSFSGFDKGTLLIVNGKKPPPSATIVITGRKCSVIILNKTEAIAKYGKEGRLGAVEVTTADWQRGHYNLALFPGI